MPLQAPLKKEDDTPVSVALDRVVDDHKQHVEISIEQLMAALQERGFGLLMAMLVLPNCVPLPLPPGLSTILSVPLLIVSAQMLVGLDHPWMPAWLRRKRIGHGILARAVRSIAPKLRWVERFLRPRLSFASTQTGERVVGLCWLLFSLTIAVPLPTTNFIPGVGILVMSLGLLSKDGLVMLVGMCIGAAGFVYTAMILTLGTKAVMALLPFLAGG